MRPSKVIAKALRVHLDELVPGELPAWEKDLRGPTAKAGDGQQFRRFQSEDRLSPVRTGDLELF